MDTGLATYAQMLMFRKEPATGMHPAELLFELPPDIVSPHPGTPRAIISQVHIRILADQDQNLSLTLYCEGRPHGKIPLWAAQHGFHLPVPIQLFDDNGCVLRLSSSPLKRVDVLLVATVDRGASVVRVLPLNDVPINIVEGK